MIELCYKIREMEQLLTYLFGEWVSEVTPFIAQLFEGKAVPLTSRTVISPEDLQTVQLLVVKNFVHYSPAHLTLRLSSKNVLLYQRLHKVRHFAETHLNKSFASVLSAFIENELLPVGAEGRDWEQGKGKESKKRKGEEDVDYSRLMYESSEASRGQEEAEFVVNIEKLT